MFDYNHHCHMVLQRVDEQGQVIYRCACGNMLIVSMLGGATSSPPLFAPFGEMHRLPQIPRTPVPEVFHDAIRAAFGDDDYWKDGVPL